MDKKKKDAPKKNRKDSSLKKEPVRDFETRFFEGVLKRSPHYAEAMISLAELYTRKGEYEKGLEMDLALSRLMAGDPVVHYNLACSLALVGRPKEALKALRRAISLGYTDFEHMRKDPDLISLKEDPDFKSLSSIA